VRCSEAVERARELRARLDAEGVTHLELDGLLTTDQFVALARTLGDPQPETAAEIARFVDDGVVLNLTPALEWSADVALVPFSWSAVRLHTEGSARPRRVQPRYVMLHCVEPGSPTTGDQTIMVSMADVRERLTNEQMAVLSAVRLDDLDDASPLAPAVAPPTFCFRDFGADEIRWVCSRPEINPDDIERAIVDLAVGMYTAPCFGVRWARHALVVIDNHRFFHGRTRGAGAHRHLRRIRVGQPAVPSAGNSSSSTSATPSSSWDSRVR
jgi:alpha-ketoglutarate-dependent taurine dioxygenase